MEEIMNEENCTLKYLTFIFKIICLIFYIVLTTFVIYFTFDTIHDVLNPVEGVIQLPGLGFAIAVIIVGGIGALIISLFSSIGFVFSIANKYSSKRKNNIVFFVIFFFLPVLTVLICTLIGLPYFQ